MLKNFPKVEFSIAPLNKIFSLIDFFLNPTKKQWDWSIAIYKNYPELKNKLKDVKNKTERKEIEYKYFQMIFKIKRKEFEKKRKIFQKEWNKLNDDVMLVLSKVVEQDWPEKDKKIFARVSLNPICPRYIKQRTFDVFYEQKPNYMKSVAIHEILHFIYFEKWKRVFPKTKEKEFDAPHLVWQLSEMVPKIILSDKRVQKVFRYKFDSYKEYENFKLNRKDFADFLKKSWKFVKKHEKQINSI
jgi:hypothetical protein